VTDTPARPSPLDRALIAITKLEAKLAATERARSEPIAIIGLGCRFPGGASDPAAYWQMLLDGVDGVAEIPATRWPRGATAEGDDPPPAGVGWAGLLPDVAGFDGEFFGLSPRELQSLDPQHRLVLEVAWEALEDAGVPAASLVGTRTGVYIGATTQDYQTQITAAGLAHLDAYTAIGNGLCFAAGRLSYVLGLQGPAMTLDTACSSSLTATHLAVASLRAGECDLALVGGVNLILSPLMMTMMARTHALSPDGRCKTFDARANGIARGEGCGVLVCKRLGDAQRDGDRIWAVIRGSAVNQDGRSTGMTTPNVLAQQALLRQALANARVDASRVAYVEAHGTGTSLGDPIEVEALKAVLGAPRPDHSPCALGAVKTNLGHLEAAAGVAGLIKAVLALRHGQVPRNLHFETLNPRIDLAGTPFFVPTATTELRASGGPLIAGVSSFGLSGTNAHVVLEQAPPAPPVAEAPRGRAELVVLSAHGPAALAELAGRLHARVAADPDLSVYELAWACQRRSPLPARAAIAARDRDALLHALDRARRGDSAPGLVRGEVLSDGRPRVVFVFPGQGSQWVGMGRRLLAAEPVFAAELARCDAAIARHAGWSLLQELAADGPASRLDELDVVQPALFAVSVALAALWRSWGVEPDAIVGHSMGEIAAAHVAGALDLEAAALISCRRSRLVRPTVARGCMAIAELTLDEAAELLRGHDGRITIGGSNSPRTTILSGEYGAFEALAAELARRDVFFRLVRGTPPSHGPCMDPLGPELLAALADLRPRAGAVPILSTVTGDYSDGADLDARYWQRNLREPVRFTQAIRRLADDGHQLFLEVSAHPVLLGPMQQTLADHPARTLALGSLRRDQDEPITMLEALGAAFAAGLPLELRRRMPVAARPLTLPTYPWQRSRHWIDLTPAAPARPAIDPAAHPLLQSAFHAADAPGAHFWRTDLSLRQHPWLRDHAVHGTAVLPATAYLEMARAAAELVRGPGAHQVEAVELLQALAIPADDARHVQLALREDGPRRLAFTISSRVDGEPASSPAGWLLHARGAVLAASTLPDPDPAPLALDDLRARCREPLDPAAHHAAMAAMGIHYGPTFQGLQQLWRRPGEALGQLALPPALAADAARHGAHPALLDAAFQLLVAAFTGPAGLPDGATFLPVRLGAVRLHRRPEGPLWAHARVTTPPGAARPGGELDLYDASGAPVLSARGLEMQALEVRAPQDPDAQLLHELRWQPAPVPAGPALAGAWLVLGADPLADALARRLLAADATVLHAPTARLPPVQRPLQPLLQGLLDRGQPLRGVVHLALGPELPDDAAPEALLDRQRDGYGLALALAQELSWLGLREPPRLFLVTRGVAPVPTTTGAAPPVTVTHAPLHGLATVLAHELPELRVTVVDLDPAAPRDELAALLAELGADDREDQVALRPGGRHVARLVHADPRPAAPTLRVPARAQPFRLGAARPGVLDDLDLHARERPAPGPGEVEIEVSAAGLNFRDVLQALGVIPDDVLAHDVAEARLGGECAGVVTAVGPGVDDLVPGQRVVALGLDCFSSHVLAPAALVAAIPPGLSDLDAATLPVVFMTAYHGLHQVARLAPGERVLIHAATGGVGLAAVQWAQHVGAEVYATAGSPEKRAHLAALGVRHVSDSRSDRFVADIMAWTGGQGVDVVLNSLSGELLEHSFGLLRAYGRFVELGKRDYHANTKLGLRPFLRNLTLSLVNLRTLVVEHPTRARDLLLEVLRHFAAGVFRPLPVTAFPVSRAADAFRHMAQARHVGKLAVDMRDPDATVRVALAAPAAPRGTWVITGGLTGVGLATVDWLVDAGVRSFALLGRRPPGPDARAHLDVLAARGVHVHVAAVDVAEREPLAHALATVRATCGPIHGLVHAAAVLDDRGLLAQDLGHFERTFRAKAQGAWNLHALTLADPLDHFVLYSSGASILGSPGQANYCAANALVDALAHRRRAAGRPALTINWGLFGGIGLAAEQANRGERVAAQGMDPLDPARAGRVFRRLLGEPRTQVAVMALDLRRWRQSYPRAASGPLLADLAVELPDAQGPASPLRQRLAAAARDQQRALLVAHIAETLAQVLRVDLARVAPTTRMGNLGLDSLMAIELRNRLEASTGLTLSVTMIWNYPTPAQLAEHLADKLGGGAPEPAPEAAAAPEPTALERSLADASDADLGDLFDAQLAELEDLV